MRKILTPFFYSLALASMLCGCSGAQSSAANAADTADTEAHASTAKVKEMLGIAKKPPEKRLAAEVRYCYRTYGDIICYRKPIPGEEYRLVGYQESSGATGTVIQPTLLMDGGETPLPPLTSVAVPAPPQVAGSTGAGKSASPHKLKEIVFDPAELEPKTLVPEKSE